MLFFRKVYFATDLLRGGSLGQILDPFALFQHESADGTFQKIGSLANGKQGDDGKIRKPA